MLILGEFLSGPRVAWGTSQGKGVTFSGCKIQLSGGWACLSVSVVERWADGCPFPACDKGVKNHRKGLHYPEWERPMWLAARPPLSFTPPLQQHCREPQSFILLSPALTPFLPPAPPPPPSSFTLSCSPSLKKRASTMLLGRLEWILQHPCGQRTCGQHSQDVCQLH